MTTYNQNGEIVPISSQPDPSPEPFRVGGPLRDAAVDPLPGDLVIHERDPHLTRPPDGGTSVGAFVGPAVGQPDPIRPVRRSTRR